jgi:glycerol-3-phosphate O-acyltransferase/dihydroxyacetone phosphate acyltransferase
MSLGDHVRVVRTFLEAFKAADDSPDADGHHPEEEEKTAAETAELAQLRLDLRVYLSRSPPMLGFT